MTEPSQPLPSLAQLSPVKLALLAQQERARSEPVLRVDPIAIVGMGCRLPGGVVDVDSFWRLLRDGVDAVREAPHDRWNVAGLFDPDPSAPGKMASRWGGFLDAIDGFDAAYFGILPREAEQMDPQQRLFLEVAIEAIEHAGLTREQLAGSRTGAFVASYYNDYAQLQAADPQAIDSRTLTGTLHSVLVNRLSYLLDLRGPSVSVDTACSSSLVAIHLACQSLRHGECDAAIAGGVSLMVGETPMITLSKVGFMAPDGRCKTFDARADGFGRGEGCSVLVLKRLADALADGDRVLALVRGSAVNQDGHSTVLAAPNGLAQQALIREALANAQLEPSRIGYVEAHGTGTALGDPIEVEALAHTVGRPAAGAGPCLLGAAKANIGHLEAAAGVTGVLKSVLVLQHGEVPPQVHFRSLNPHISLAGTRLSVPTRPTPWPAGMQPRCAGVSGFGVGGTNAHVVLEEAPRLGASDASPLASPPWLLPLSARSNKALRALAARWIDRLAADDQALPALCAAAAQRRSHHEYRLAVLAGSSAEAIERLKAYLADAPPSGWVAGSTPAGADLRIAFVFPGQGQQWAGMASELLTAEPVFRAAIERIDSALRAHVDWSLLEVLSAPPEASRLDDTEVAQPAIFALQVALCRQWAHWGIRADGVVGHSVGEIAALHVAGVLGLEEALRVVVQRARFMQAATGHGAMAAVSLSPAEARRRLAGLGDRVSIGAINSPTGVVLSGEVEALRTLLASLAEEGIAQRELPVNYAFHSAQMHSHAAALEAALGSVASTASGLAVYSTVSGRRLGSAEADAGYFGRNVRDTVRFADAVDTMLADGFTTFVEIGAHPVLAANIVECAAGRGIAVQALASMRRGRPQRESLLHACAGVYAFGRAPDWVALQGAHAQVLDLPAYPWQHERFWLRRPRSHRGDGWIGAAAGPASLLGARLPVAGSAVFQAHWPDAAPAWLADHRLGGRVLMPATGMLEVLRQAAVQSAGRTDLAVEDFVVHRPLEIDEAEAAVTVWQVVATARDEQHIGLSMYTSDPRDPLVWHEVASARAIIGEAVEPAGTRRVHEAGLGGEAAYAAFANLGVTFGRVFRTIESLSVDPDGATATLQAPASVDPGADGGCHPALLDGALQACVAALDGGRPASVYLPVGVGRYVSSMPAPARLQAEVTVSRVADGASLEAEARLFDEAGRCVATLQGVRFARAPSAMPSASADAWLHEVVWVRDDPSAVPAGQPEEGAWLVVGLGADAATLAEATSLALCDAGQVCRLLCPDGSGPPLPVDAMEPHWRHGRRLTGVALLVSEPDADALLRWVAPVLSWAQALVGSETGASLSLVTIGAQAAGEAVPHPGAAALWGLGSAIAAEHAELGLRMLDLDPDAARPDAGQLAAELMRGRSAVPRLAWRAGERLVPRLQRRPGLPAAAPPRKLVPGRSGSLEDLAWKPLDAEVPKAGEVRLRVDAAGLNFRDVLMALGMIPDQLGFMGAECAGVIQAVGAGVDDLAVGDTVFGLAPGSLASEVIVPAAFVARWPDELGTLELAASLPAAFLTAMLGLNDIAGLRSGQTVLIHAAAGGVGWAAVQLALRAGATVFATAGSPAKREMLRALGVAQVFDSRSLDFAGQVRAATAGRGADVVLNSLAGEFIAASVEALADDGCFLELGKRELWTAERFRAVRPAARYEVYDLGSTARAEPARVRPMLHALLDALAAGRLQPPPLRVLAFDEAAQAMRLMAQARHVGKLVLRAPRASHTRAGRPVHADASYLITGGLGALGLHAARWLAGKGARHIVLTGRQAPGPRAQTALEELARLGATVSVRRVDAGDAVAMASLIGELAHSPAPLRGVIHAAGQLEDGALIQLDERRLGNALHGKAEGARLLDVLTRKLPLDFFVVFSAAGLLLGPAGQGAYAAANAALDAVAQARARAGLPALSVAWGLWAEGMAAGPGQAGWAARGLGTVNADGGLARLDRLLDEAAVHAAVLPIDWPRFLSRLPAGIDRAFFARVTTAPKSAAQSRPAAAAASLAVRWRELPPGQRREAMLQDLARQALQVLGLGADTVIGTRRPLKDVGLDSLMAVELRNLLARSVDTPLPATLLFDYPTLEALADYLIRKLDLLPAAPNPTTPEPSGQCAVAALSDEEAEIELLAELDARPAAPRS